MNDTTAPTSGAPAVAHGPAGGAAQAVLARFEEWARTSPHAPAVTDGAHDWTYEEISAAADEAAAVLRGRVRPGDLVGVCLDRSAALVVAAVALARLGAVYLPLGPRPGARRTEAVAEDLDVVCLIGDPGVLPPAHRDGEQVKLPLPDRGANAVATVVAAFAEERAAGARRAPAGAFYAVLTSGSTGRPKAVAVGERSLAGLLDWYRDETGLAPGDRQSLLIGVAFDPHVMELWAGLTSGAALVPAPDEVRWDPAVLAEWWRDAAVTVSVAATPMAEPLLEGPWPADLVLRHLVVGGDRMRRHPGADVTATVHNAYGPAEATVVTTVHTIRPGERPADLSSAPPIGRPVPGATVAVTGPDGRPVAVGEEGELRIGGALLALGYVDPELTARRFTGPPVREDAAAPGASAPAGDAAHDGARAAEGAPGPGAAEGAASGLARVPGAADPQGGAQAAAADPGTGAPSGLAAVPGAGAPAGAPEATADGRAGAVGSPATPGAHGGARPAGATGAPVEAPPAPPVSAVPGVDRLYRTGDRVRMDADGVLEFLGRLDDQVKVGGVRIEPAEVEAAFEQDPGVGGAVVTASRTPEGRTRLVAHVRPAPGARPVGDALLAAVRAWLPEQAVPAAVRIVDAFPLDANGKVDRAELARQPDRPAEPGAEPTAGATFGERLVLTAVRGELGLPDAGLDDDFTSAGGTSLAAARLLAVIRREAGVRLRAPELLRQPDLRAVAALVDARRTTDRRTEGT
ncbi:non-ribosomal peptide synthetase [Streptomyces sp. NPDC005805]|uniref:non-ribosomal peptide synthetase n=1 Tax=Streptomyces sp. NPDC005805 TaxID=3157068 RepID=UPI0033C384F4